MFLKKGKKHIYCCMLALAVIFLSVGSCFAAMLPQSNPISSTVYTYNVDNQSQGVRLAAISLQGLVNRTTPRIYIYHTYGDPATDPRKSQWQLDYYKSKGWVTSETNYTDIYTMINAFKGSINGAVVYDPNQNFTINLATNVAGCENLIIISPDMISSIQALGITIQRDLRGMFTNPYDACVWAYNTYWPQQSRTLLANTYYMRQHDYHRDYLIQNKVHTFWLPGPSDPDWSQNLENQIGYILNHAPANIAIMGFTWAQDDQGNERGPNEYFGTKFIGKYSKYHVVNDWAGNYSFHSGVQVSDSVFKQQEARQKTFRGYDPAKKYVTFTIIESLDTPSYHQFGFKYYQWDDSYRGQVPINYGFGPSVKYLMPGIMSKWYTEATANDFFFNAISGLGYCYPLEGYGDYGMLDSQGQMVMNKDQVLTDFFQKTGEEMKGLDLDMYGMYTHPGTAWTNPADDNIVNTYITPNINGLTTIIADMGRNEGTTAANANRMMSNSVSIHNCLTKWPTGVNYNPPSDPSTDAAAVGWLVNEIRNQSSGGNFIHAMAYSWFYGPHRLKMVQDELADEGYEFVTLNEFEHLYRESQSLQLPSRDPNNVLSTKITDGTVTSSSQFNSDYVPSKARDGLTGSDWATTNADRNTGWIQITWGSAKSINKIVLRDRPNSGDQITSGILSFSDGTSIDVGSLPNSGVGTFVEFPAKNITWVRFTITSTSASTFASGLCEFETYNTPIPVYYTDLARGKPAAASGVWQSNPDFDSSKAVDGKDSTYWASNTSGSTWMQVNLSGVYTINRVRMKWECGGSYVIQTSTDGENYTTVKTGTAASGGITDDTFSATAARYVKISADSYRSIYLLEAYNMPATGTDRALNKTVTSSGVWNGDQAYAASKAVDGNDGTRWASNNDGSDVWIKVDLGSNYTIGRIRIKWDYCEKYNIWVSTDNVNFTKVMAVGASPLNITTDDTILPVTARYVKIEAGSGGNPYRSIYSLNVY